MPSSEGKQEADNPAPKRKEEQNRKRDEERETKKMSENGTSAKK